MQTNVMDIQTKATSLYDTAVPATPASLAVFPHQMVFSYHTTKCVCSTAKGLQQAYAPDNCFNI